MGEIKLRISTTIYVYMIIIAAIKRDFTKREQIKPILKTEVSNTPKVSENYTPLVKSFAKPFNRPIERSHVGNSSSRQFSQSINQSGSIGVPKPDFTARKRFIIY